MVKKISENELAGNSLNLPPQLSHRNAESVALTHFFTPSYMDMFAGAVSWGVPYVVLGEPGVGKTASNYQLALRLFGEDGKSLVESKRFVSWKPGSRGDGAFGVVPTPVRHTRPDGTVITALDFPPPLELVRMMDSDTNPACMLFLDELTTAPDMVKAALLALLQEGEIGSFRCSPRTRLIAGANPPDMGTNAKPFTPPEANRMFHYMAPRADIEVWGEYMANGGAGNLRVRDEDKIHIKDLEDHVLSKWNLEYAKTCGLMIGFAKRHGLHKMPDVESDAVQGPWQSSRTMEYLTRVLTTSTILGQDSSVQDILVHGGIGGVLHSQFVAYRSATKIPDPISVLEEREDVPHDADLAYATFKALDTYLRGLGPIANLADRNKMSKEDHDIAMGRWKQFGKVALQTLGNASLKSATTAVFLGMQQAQVLPLAGGVLPAELMSRITKSFAASREVSTRFRFQAKN